MRYMILIITFILSFYNYSFSYGQDNDSIINRLREHVETVNYFSHYVPQEKVYLHFDNNSYYEKDKIWFKCYVVTSALNKPANLSKTLYVDLLNPGGEVVEKKVLEIRDGQCSGSFTLTNRAFYSGFFEVRAYTKYMLNFGEKAIFSRVFPVFKQPQVDGDFSDRQMQKNVSNYTMKRDKIKKNKNVDVIFYPEGGNLIAGVASRIAFQATDEYGQPIDITGRVLGLGGEQLVEFSTVHEGRGSFLYTPSSEGKQKAQIIFEDKEYEVDLPEVLSQGYVMNVDNISKTDNISVTINKNDTTQPDMLGLAVLYGGGIYHLDVVDFKVLAEASLQIPKTVVPSSGVAQILLFDKQGEVFCDRLIFINKGDRLSIKSRQNKETYDPYEIVNLDFTVADKNNNPVNTYFSLSVKDAKHDVYYTDNIQTNLLLSSDIKGYIHNPAYYFESDDIEHCQALDLLLMVQGWRRHVWKQMAGIEPFDLKYVPEKGVEIQGQVKMSRKEMLNSNTDVFLHLSRDTEEGRQSNSMTAKLDTLGRFKIISDLSGKWDMALGVSQKGKKKNKNIILDRLFRPKSKTYNYAELLVELTKDKTDKTRGEDKGDVDDNSSIEDDDLGKAMSERTHHLEEVTVSAKLENKPKETVAYYDVQTEINNIIDDGGYTNQNIMDFLVSIDPNFRWEYDFKEKEHLYKYKGKKFRVIFDKSTARGNNFKNALIDWIDVTNLSAVKSISVDITQAAITAYAPDASFSDGDPRLSLEELSREYGCIVFIEMYPEGKIPNMAKGVRKLKLEGYDLQTDFFSPDYSILPKEVDYRRTLYWNPDVKTNSQGEASVQFYNNSTCRRMIISAETMTSDGKIGVCESD